MIDNVNPQVESLKSQIQSQKQMLAELGLTADTGAHAREATASAGTVAPALEPDGAKFDRGQYGDLEFDVVMDELTLTPAAVQSNARASATLTDTVRMLSHSTLNSSD